MGCIFYFGGWQSIKKLIFIQYILFVNKKLAISLAMLFAISYPDIYV